VPGDLSERVDLETKKPPDIGKEIMGSYINASISLLVFVFIDEVNKTGYRV